MRVVFVQKFVPHYRLPFFERIRDLLTRQGIEFILLYCEPDPYENSKVQMVYPDWGIRVNTRHFKLSGRYLYWASVMQHIKQGDLVVVEHAAKLLNNYAIFLARQLGWLKMGYFGHGQNFQATTELRLSALVKKLMLRRTDHWFAYTEVSRQSLLRQSVDDAVITVVNNTLAPSENAVLGKREPEPYSCIYIGGLYSLKLLPLLIESSALLAAQFPDFKLYVVGDGPEKTFIDSCAMSKPWLCVQGALYSDARDELLARCNAILMPGLVGLITIDSFQFERPIITSDAGEHSPEIAYLEDGKNCLIDHGINGKVTAESYANTVSQYLGSSELQRNMRDNCRKSAQTYSIDRMAESFVNAIVNNG
jgi:glycosyltransferase involved in cell wall biosynthesis